MEYTYTEAFDETGKLIAVNRSDGWWIPADESNSDYQAYLAYVANGNKAPNTLASELSNPSNPQAGE